MTSSVAKTKPKPVAAKPRAGAHDPRPIVKPSEFRRFYDRGDLPLCVDFQGATRKVGLHVQRLTQTIMRLMKDYLS